MQNFQNKNNFISDNENEFDFVRSFYKYFFFWKYFVISLAFVTISAFLYLRYTPKQYNSYAKIKILDKNENSFEMPTAKDLFSNSKINLENEVEILQSFPIIERVVNNLNLFISVIEIGDIMESLTLEYPFDIELKIPKKNIIESKYRLNILENGLEIYNTEASKKYLFKDFVTIYEKHDLPFEINKIASKNWKPEGYYIHLQSVPQVVKNIKKNLLIN